MLHVCGDFAKQNLYTQLVLHLSGQGVAQIVYAPVRTTEEALWSPPELASIPHHLRLILSPRDRFLFRSKIRRVARDIRSQVEMEAVRLIHAHFLYSDGAAALELNRSLGVPYIVAVQNTDINVFMRYRPDLRAVRDRVLNQAARVVFFSPAYQRLLYERLDGSTRERVAAKSSIMPAGVRPGWLGMPPSDPRRTGGELRLLYVGDFSRNKNVRGILEATSLLRATRPVRLTLVGGGGAGKGRVEIERLLRSGRYAFAKHLGRIDDPALLRQIYCEHDVFVMPSRLETFGVVYVEALSQGLPIVHSRGQGVDGFFQPGTVAEAVDPDDPADIAAKVTLLANRLPAIRESCVREARRFDWASIARSYADLYDAVTNEAEAVSR